MSDDTVAEPPPRPKRPLSAYNLFYRYKRGKIVKVSCNKSVFVLQFMYPWIVLWMLTSYVISYCSHCVCSLCLKLPRSDDDDSYKEAVTKLIMALPGLEEYHSINDSINDLSSDSMKDVNDLRRTDIRTALMNNLSADDAPSKRSHRKSGKGSALSFLEMNKMMCTSWAQVDEFAKNIFRELADEGRALHKKRVAEYNAKYGAPAPKKMRYTVPSTSAPMPTQNQLDELSNLNNKKNPVTVSSTSAQLKPTQAQLDELINCEPLPINESDTTLDDLMVSMTGLRVSLFDDEPSKAEAAMVSPTTVTSAIFDIPMFPDVNDLKSSFVSEASAGEFLEFIDMLDGDIY